MRTTGNVLLAGAAAVLALAGSAGLAMAGTPQTHVLTLRLPNGQTEQVRYTGSVAPTVILDPELPDPAFTMLDQMAAAMDRQAAALFQAFDEASAPGFQVVPELAGPGLCMRSVQITYTAGAQAPHVLSRTVGDCGAAPGAEAPTVALPSAPAPDRTAAVIHVRDTRPYQAMLRPVSDPVRRAATVTNWQP